MAGSSTYRRSIEALHSGEDEWKPTPIQIPSSSRQPRASSNQAKNPFSFHSNLHDKSRPNGSGNHRNAVATTNTIPKRGLPKVSNGVQPQLDPLKARPGASRSVFETPSTSKTPGHYDEHIDGASHLAYSRRKSALVTEQYDTLEPDPDTSEDPILLQPGGTVAGSSSSSNRRGSTQSSKPRLTVQGNFDISIEQSLQYVGGRATTPSKRQAPRISDDQTQRKRPRPSPAVQGELSDDRIQVPGPSTRANIPIIDFASSTRGKMKGRKVTAETPNRSRWAKKGNDDFGTTYPDRSSFLPIKTLYWGEKILYEDEEPDHHPISWIGMSSAPALQLYSDHTWNMSPKGTVDLIIPLNDIASVQYAEPGPLNYFEISVKKKTKFTPPSHRLVKSGWLELNSSIGFELDFDSPRWHVEESPSRYNGIIERLRAHGCDCSSVRPTGIISLRQMKREIAVQFKNAKGKAKDMRNNEARTTKSVDVTEPSSSKLSSGPKPRPTTRRTSSRIKIEDARPRSPPPNANELVLVYPPAGTGAVNITVGDYRRLDPGEFYNDTLIEFGLKLAFNKLKASHPQLAEEIHIFNSFFYKKLSSRLSTDGYQSVRKWTTKFRLFKKKFLIVPINENFHWYLAIIYNPGNVLPPDPLPTLPPKASLRPTRTTRSSVTGPVSPPRLIANQDTSVEGSDDAKSNSGTDLKVAEKAGDHSPPSDGESIQEIVTSASQVNLGSEDVALHDSHSTPTTVPHSPFHTPAEEGRQRFSLDDSMEVDVPPLSDSTTGQGSVDAPPSVIDVDEDMLDGTASHGETVREEHKAPQLLARVKDIHKAHIFILDSLGSSDHREPRRILGDYLLQEAHDKELITPAAFEDIAVRMWFKTHVAGHNVKVPLQPNHCDCGVYLVHFAETFLDNPEGVVQGMGSVRPSIEARNLLWKKGELDQKRASIKEKVDALAEEWRKLQGLSAVAQAPSQSQPIQTASGINDGPPVEEPSIPVINALDGSSRPATAVSMASQVDDAEEVEGILQLRSSTISDQYQIKQGIEPPSYNLISNDSDLDPGDDLPDRRVLRSKPPSASFPIFSKEIPAEHSRPRVTNAGSHTKSSPMVEKPSSRGSDRRVRLEPSPVTTPRMAAQASTSITSGRRSPPTSPFYVPGDDEDEEEPATMSSKQREDRKAEKGRENDIIIPETDDEAESIGGGAEVGEDYTILPPFALNRAPAFPSTFRRAFNVKPPASLSDSENDIVSVSRNQGSLLKKATIEGPPARLRG